MIERFDPNDRRIATPNASLDGATVPRLAVPVGERDHVLGSWSAPTTLVEYADFECLHCRRAFPALEELHREAGDALCIVFRHLPLDGHPHAWRAAEASEAAAAQGKFWQMHDTLYRYQLALDAQALDVYAEEIGLDLTRFRDEMRRGVYAERVAADLASGKASGVRGTPTFFLDGERYGDGRDLDALRRSVLNAVRSAAVSASDDLPEHRAGRVDFRSPGDSVRAADNPSEERHDR